MGELGETLGEVFSVKINIRGKDTCNLYGTITVQDGLSTQPIYNVDKDHSQSIKPWETVNLTGPSRCISGYDLFVFFFDLWDYSALPDGEEKRKEEVINNYIVWNVYTTDTDEYDVLLTNHLYSEFSSATLKLNYAVLKNAVTATVAVTFLEGGDFFDLFGTMAVRNEGINEPSEDMIIKLFQKTRDSSVNVKRGELIPLSRSAVVVSLGYSLTVWVRLYDYNTDIACRTLEFPARLNGTDKMTADGNSGVKVEVKVTWNKR